MIRRRVKRYTQTQTLSTVVAATVEERRGELVGHSEIRSGGLRSFVESAQTTIWRMRQSSLHLPRGIISKRRAALQCAPRDVAADNIIDCFICRFFGWHAICLLCCADKILIFSWRLAMRKLSFAVIAAASLWCAQASAIPITWTVGGTGPFGGPEGTFIYDADSNAYSGIDLLGQLSVLPSNTFISGSASQLVTRNALLTLILNFVNPLTNAGGTIAFTSATGSRILGVINGYPGTVTTNVPEPGSLMLLGAGLAGLGLLRRRKQAA